MTPQKKAEGLVHQYRMLLMNEGEDYGEEILVSILAKQCALIAVDEIMQAMDDIILPNPFKQYWNQVKQEINKL